MDPNTQTPSPTTPAGPPANAGPGRRRRFPRPTTRKQIILVIIAIILVILALVFAVNGLRQRHNSSSVPDLSSLKPGDISGPYYEREGYPRQKIGPLIGDAMALTLEKNDRPLKAAGIAIFPACALLTQDNVRKTGLQTKASADDQSGVQMIYVDGKGSAPIPYDDRLILNESNQCTYQLANDAPGQVNTVALSVYQPFQASPVAIREEVSVKYQQASPIAGVSGVNMFTLRSAQNGGRDTRSDTSEYYIAKDDKVVFRLRLQYGGNDRQAKIESLIKTVLSNIDALSASPQGTPTASYKNSPTYKQEYLRACSFMSDAGLKTLGAKQAAAAVKENLSKGAQRQLAAFKADAKKTQGVSGVGDEAIVSNGAAGFATELIFRQGRYVISIEYDAANQDRTGLTDLSKYEQTVKPFAEYISRQIKSD